MSGPVPHLRNDLPDNIKSSVCLFADDCVLYRNIHSLQDCLILQEDLTRAVSSEFPLVANVCPNLPGVRSFMTLP